MSEAKDFSVEQEERVAKIFHGHRTPRSGGGNFQKSDVQSQDFCVECKCRVVPTASYSVSKEVIDKNEHERAEMRKPYSALAIELGDKREDYFVVSKREISAFIEMMEAVRDLKKALIAEINELDKSYASQGSPTERTVALYRAHKQEKKAMLESLDKIIE